MTTQALSQEAQQIIDLMVDDLALLSLLHDREITKEVLALLADIDFPQGLSLMLHGDEVQQATELISKNLAKTTDENTQQFLEDLATDYADIYLNYSLNASPFESVWLDEENLLMQAPMFEVRQWYDKFSLKVENWRTRSDDHFICQLQFVAHVLAQKEAKNLQELSTFLDEHLFRWFDKFSAKVANRCATPFYAGLAILTYYYIDEVRNFLAEVTQTARPSKEEIEAKFITELPQEENVQYVPGASVSW